MKFTLAIICIALFAYAQCEMTLPEQSLRAKETTTTPTEDFNTCCTNNCLPMYNKLTTAEQTTVKTITDCYTTTRTGITVDNPFDSDAFSTCRDKTTTDDTTDDYLDCISDCSASIMKAFLFISMIVFYILY